MNEHYPINIFSVQINKDNNQNAFLNNENSNPFLLIIKEKMILSMAIYKILISSIFLLW